ncbi:MAG: right-handed parallel beta-helix repeat-containing protein [Pseudomonadota bacterium]
MLYRLALLLLVLSTGCFRSGFEREVARPTFDHTWTVNVVEDRAADATDLPSPLDPTNDRSSLSLREALVLASASPGTDRIHFDPELFHADSPAHTTLTGGLPGLRDRGIFVDGTGAGLVLHGDGLTGPCLEVLANDVRITHLTLTGCGDPALRISGAARVELAALRILETAGRGLEAVDTSELQVDGLDVADSADSGLVLEGVHGATLTRVHVDRSGLSAIQILASQGVVLREGSISVTGDDALLVQASTEVLIDRVQVVLDVKDAFHGIHLDQVRHSVVQDCFVDPGSAWMIVLSDASDNRILRNLIDGGDSGIVLEGDSDRNLILQNIITGCVYDGVYLHGGADENIIAHTSVHACSSGVVGGLDTSQVANNLHSSDAFVDPAAYDFRLVAGSPAIDAGEDLGYDLVLGSETRFLGLAPDLGAVESF